MRNQRAQYGVAIIRRRSGPAWGRRRSWRRGSGSYNRSDELHMQPGNESGEHRSSASHKNGRGERFTEVHWYLYEKISVLGQRGRGNCCAFNKQSRITSAILLSSTSPPSKSNSEPRSRIHPGIMRVPWPVPVCCEAGGVTFMRKSVAVEWRIYKFASTCSW
jgi:hypothetical protein